MTPVLGLIIIALHAAIVIPAAVFCVHYTVVADWWRSPTGINLFGVSACMAVAFGFNLAVFLIGAFWWLPFAAVLIFAAIAAFMWQRYILFIRAQGCSWRGSWRLVSGRARQVADFCMAWRYR